MTARSWKCPICNRKGQPCCEESIWCADCTKAWRTADRDDDGLAWAARRARRFERERLEAPSDADLRKREAYRADMDQRIDERLADPNSKTSKAIAKLKDVLAKPQTPPIDPKKAERAIRALRRGHTGKVK